MIEAEQSYMCLIVFEGHEKPPALLGATQPCKTGHRESFLLGSSCPIVSTILELCLGFVYSYVHTLLPSKCLSSWVSGFGFGVFFCSEGDSRPNKIRAKFSRDANGLSS